MAQMTGIFFGLIKDAHDMATKATEAMVDKVEAIVKHPEVAHVNDLLDKLADRNMEYVQTISDYGTDLIERISTRNEPKSKE